MTLSALAHTQGNPDTHGSQGETDQDPAYRGALRVTRKVKLNNLRQRHADQNGHAEQDHQEDQFEEVHLPAHHITAANPASFAQDGWQ